MKARSKIGEAGKVSWHRWLAAGCTALLFLIPAWAHAQNTLHWTTNYFSVTGASLSEIRQSLNQSRPWKNLTMDGLTEWRIDWRYEVMPTTGGCRCSSFTTTTTIKITLPRWVPPTNAPAATQQEWSRYITALGQHEAGHARIALAAVAEQHKQIKDLGEMSDCDGLGKKIDGLARSITEDYRRRDNEYDQRTEHGAKQGAFLPGRDEYQRPRRE